MFLSSTRQRSIALAALLLPTTAIAATTVGSAGAAESPVASYIVVLEDGTIDPGAVAEAHAASVGGTVGHVYRHAIKGYSVTMPSALVAAVESKPGVRWVEADGLVQASTTVNTSYWNVDRSDQRALPLSGTYTYTATGAGVRAYVLDTGIRFTHTQFGGRAVSGFDSVDGGTADDCNGHGTHVAGTIGGSTVGLAKSVSLVAVRVLDCGGGGTISGVIAGVDWVTANAVKPAVANMSLGGGGNTSLDTAVSNSINSGIAYSVAAGNGNMVGIAQDACKYSPARVADAITIGATDKSDRKASFSNYGNCVDWFAPGVDITSAWYTGDNAGAILSGTSMAAPAVAGVAAMYLEGNPTASPATVRNALYDLTTKKVVTSSKTVNNHLLFTNL